MYKNTTVIALLLLLLLRTYVYIHYNNPVRSSSQPTCISQLADDLQRGVVWCVYRSPPKCPQQRGAEYPRKELQLAQKEGISLLSASWLAPSLPFPLGCC